MTETVISINEITFPVGSARGIKITVEPIAQASQLERDVRFGMVDLSHPRAKQYKATLTCTDQTSPYLRDVWPGNVVTLTFPPEMIGPGSSSGDDPIVRQMRVGSWKVGWDEWAASKNWSIDLEQDQFE